MPRRLFRFSVAMFLGAAIAVLAGCRSGAPGIKIGIDVPPFGHAEIDTRPLVQPVADAATAASEGLGITKAPAPAPAAPAETK